MKAVTLARLLYRRMLLQDEDAGHTLLTKLGGFLTPQYRFSFPTIAWWKHAEFNRYLERFDEHRDFNCERRWMVGQLCRLTAAVPGDTAECGVYHGADSYLICAANEGGPRTHHIFDSFAGLSAPGQRDGRHWRAGDMAVPLDQVRRNLSRFTAVRYHPGWIPERFPEVESLKFSFVHIDVDLEQPTLDSLAFFYPRMNPGGVVVCDDYGFATCPGATEAVDRFFKDKPEKMLMLGGGGGFMIRGVTVAPETVAL